MKPYLLFSVLLLSCQKQTPDDLLQKAFDAEKNLKYNQALAYFDAAVAIDSSYADSFYHRGICYVYMVQPQKAIADYTKAIALQPNFLAAYQERASIYYAVGKYDSGIKDINFALQLDPKNKLALNIKALLLEKISPNH
ncbi:MAG: tetratricopeptide repeat protein [Flavobacterium sp.]|uniref:tetratricopeptide repeat protein n=1 Tax=Flavobacterium sp. TaxID=239 RepID=UPI003BBCA4AA